MSKGKTLLVSAFVTALMVGVLMASPGISSDSPADASIQSNSRCQMLHRVSRDATVGERVELWEGWHPWFRRSMASS